MANIGTSTKTPIRIDSTHYKIESEEINGKFYLLTFTRYDNGRAAWLCDCPDGKYRRRERIPEGCKHAIRLKSWIAEQIAAQKAQTSAITQAEAVAAAAERAADDAEFSDCMLALIERMPTSSQAEPATTASSLEDEMIAGFENILQWLSERMEAQQLIIKQMQEAMNAHIASQQSQMDHIYGLISALQSQQCKHNEAIIKMEERQLDDNTAIGQIWAKLESIAQEKPVMISAQNVVVRGASQSARSSTKARQAQTKESSQEPEAPAIERISTGYKVGSHKVIVAKNGLVVGCSCPQAQEQGKDCGHMKAVEKFLEQ